MKFRIPVRSHGRISTLISKRIGELIQGKDETLDDFNTRKVLTAMEAEECSQNWFYTDRNAIVEIDTESGTCAVVGIKTNRPKP